MAQIFFKVLEPLEHSVLDHADPAGHHAVVQDMIEPLEHSVLQGIRDMAVPLAGNYGICHECIHLVLWIGWRII